MGSLRLVSIALLLVGGSALAQMTSLVPGSSSSSPTTRVCGIGAVGFRIARPVSLTSRARAL